MTTRFVSAVDGSDLDDGLSWANAKATVAGALADASAGDVIKVDSAGTFTANVGISWTPPAGNVAIISVDRANSDAWTPGATEAVGAISSLFQIVAVDGASVYVYGMVFDGGTNPSGACDIVMFSTNSASSRLECESCTFRLNAPTSGAQIIFGNEAAQSQARSVDIFHRNCTYRVTVAKTGALLRVGEVDTDIVNPTIVLDNATKPSALVDCGSATHKTRLTVRDGDISGFDTTGGALFDVTNFADGSVLFKNLKVSATPAIVTGTWPTGNGAITLRNVDSGDTINVFEHRTRNGTLTEIASVFATGGAEFAGSGIGWQIVTSADCDEFNPFIVPPLFKWNETTTAQTATVEIANNSATALTDRDIWLNLSYPNSASFPSYSNDSDRNANPFTGAAADQATSTNGWTGLGGTNTQQKLTVPFTAAEKGLLEGRVYVGKASQTLFLDPLLKAA